MALIRAELTGRFEGQASPGSEEGPCAAEGKRWHPGVRASLLGGIQ